MLSYREEEQLLNRQWIRPGYISAVGEERIEPRGRKESAFDDLMRWNSSLFWNWATIDCYDLTALTLT